MAWRLQRVEGLVHATLGPVTEICLVCSASAAMRAQPKSTPHGLAPTHPQALSQSHLEDIRLQSLRLFASNRTDSVSDASVSLPASSCRAAREVDASSGSGLG